MRTKSYSSKQREREREREREGVGEDREKCVINGTIASGGSVGKLGGRKGRQTKKRPAKLSVSLNKK